MPKTFNPCGTEVAELAQSIMYTHHPRLIDAGITIEFLYASDLKLNGYPCAATVKVMSLEDRTSGSKDVRIKIDEEWWSEASDEEKRACIDHECNHIQPNTRPII